MGALSAFIKKEFCASQNNESENQEPAIIAIPAIFDLENSKNSNPSNYQKLKITHEALQAEADKRNAKAKRELNTDRYCRCGSLAECAWPIDGRGEVWRCFICIEVAGRG